MTIAVTKDKNYKEVPLFFSRLWAAHLPVGPKDFFPCGKAHLPIPLSVLYLPASQDITAGGCKDALSLVCSPALLQTVSAGMSLLILLTDVLIP